MRNRHCLKCQAQARQRWLAAREREVLPTDYFHVVFSVPHELNVLALENPRCFYDLLFSAGTAAALELAADPRHLGAEIGLIGILHTWDKICCSIRTFTVSFRRADWRRTGRPGLLRANDSFCPSKCWAVSSAISF